MAAASMAPLQYVQDSISNQVDEFDCHIPLSRRETSKFDLE